MTTRDLAILTLLQRAGPLPSAVLRAQLGMPQSTFQRGTRVLGEELLSLGRARATTWAARRPIEGLRTPMPLHEVDEHGSTRLVGNLRPVHPFGHAVEALVEDVDGGFFEADPSRMQPGPDLPWFLQNLRPEGFLGRSWLASHPELGLPGDLARWGGDDVLRYAAHHGVDGPGALLVGDLALASFLDQPSADAAFSARHVRATFPERANAATRRGLRSSSPGGEQPKFTVRTVDRGVVRDHLVKFTAPMDSAVGRRWADLLVAEHLAHEVLREVGYTAPQSTIVDVANRRFLQIERFDRHGERGRSGLVPLRALDVDGVGSDLQRWSVVTANLVRDGRLTEADHRRVVWLGAFGALIANTDMHLGNLSLALRGTRIRGLSPIYDMLPMHFAPRSNGEMHDSLWRPVVEDDAAKDVAVRYWRDLAARSDVSTGFRRVADRQARCI